CFPKDTLLLGAALENGVLTINLSEDFASVAETEGLFSLAYRSAVRTLSPMFDFTKLRFQVNGRDFAPESASFPGDINPVPGK
ncbi:MAG: GerMN domain-containing protein, partial [Clostridia bacterium]|nr:GerMN domain-containing protein [Clostridia bacterium]